MRVTKDESSLATTSPASASSPLVEAGIAAEETYILPMGEQEKIETRSGS